MRFVFESSEIMPPISDALSIVTSGAKICLNDIHYDIEERIVEILMKRKELTGFNKSILGVIKPVYSQTIIDTILIIREVVDMNIEVDNRLITDCDSCFTVLLGMNIKDKQLYFGSVEESQGKTLCQVFINVNKMNIEYTDEIKTSRGPVPRDAV